MNLLKLQQLAMDFTRLAERGIQMLKRILRSKDLHGAILITERLID
ncbi:hypothetical protein SUSAZ_02405 [Sulfolobus acidocaldarius SUSAZ]|nr:hypothetical protein SUSAZ_02405 [Sulfolobus acidocaldarius SUSAZ]